MTGTVSATQGASSCAAIIRDEARLVTYMPFSYWQAHRVGTVKGGGIGDVESEP
jgi:hypothetical protein